MKKTFTFILALTLLIIFGNANAQTGASTTGTTSLDPSVFGNGFWNVSCYNGNMMSTPSTAVYYGYYTENKLSFDSRSRFPSAAASVPSDANGSSGIAYTGLSPIGMVHTVSYKRTNITPGLYQLDVPILDDNGYLFINGVEVWSFIGCCKSHPNVWSGFIDANTTIEFRWVNLYINSYASLTFTPLNPVTLPATNVSNKSFTANWNAVNYGNSYSLDVATDSTFQNFVPPFKNLNTGNVTNFSIADLKDGANYYYRIKAYSAYGASSGYSNITKITTISNAALPVSFLQFNATKENGAVQISWSTASEETNKFFTVEKSTDGKYFEAIDTVKGSGNSSTIRTYNVVDTEIANGISYYRIKQTDVDNTSSYSKVISVHTDMTSNGISIYPNPANSSEEVYITLTDNTDPQITITVRNLQGQEYLSKAITNAGSYELIALNAGQNMAPGMYIVAVSSENNSYSQKIIIR